MFIICIRDGMEAIQKIPVQGLHPTRYTRPYVVGIKICYFWAIGLKIWTVLIRKFDGISLDLQIKFRWIIRKQNVTSISNLTWLHMNVRPYWIFLSSHPDTLIGYVETYNEIDTVVRAHNTQRRSIYLDGMTGVKYPVNAGKYWSNTHLSVFDFSGTHRDIIVTHA